jgi:hypothetical protein
MSAGATINTIKGRRLGGRRRAGLQLGRRGRAGKLDYTAFLAVVCDPEHQLTLPVFDAKAVSSAYRAAARKMLADADRESRQRIMSSRPSRGPCIGRMEFAAPRRSCCRERRSHAVDSGGGADSDSDGDPDHAVDTGSVDGVAGEPRHEWVADRQAACMSVRCCRHAASPPDFFLPSSSPGSTDANVCLEVGRG